MKTINMDIVKQNMLMTSELIKIMKILEDNGITAISFKGPTLAQIAYGDITLRQYSDLDIFINKDDAYKVQDIMLKNGYKRNLELKPSQEKTWFKYAHDIGFINNCDVLIECHWSMLNTDHPVSLSNMDFLNDTSTLLINNTQIPIISNEKFFVYLCIHGSKHLFERIEWVVDIDKYIRTQDIDWDEIDRIILDNNGKRFFLLGLFISFKLYDTPIKNKLINQFDDDLENIVNYILSVWNKEKEFSTKSNLKFMLKLFVSKKDKIKYFHKKYFRPTLSEYWYITFPYPLHFLYYPLRQYLLLKKYFFNKN